MATRVVSSLSGELPFCSSGRSPFLTAILDEKNVAVKKGSRSLLQVPEANGADKVAFFLLIVYLLRDYFLPQIVIVS